MNKRDKKKITANLSKLKIKERVQINQYNSFCFGGGGGESVKKL